MEDVEEGNFPKRIYVYFCAAAEKLLFSHGA
jgi:hypothetical protein